MQRVRRILPGISLTPAARRATASGLVHRVAAATTPASVPLLLEPLRQLHFELCTLGYPPRILDLALKSFVYDRRLEPHFPVWLSLLSAYLSRTAAADFKPP